MTAEDVCRVPDRSAFSGSAEIKPRTFAVKKNSFVFTAKFNMPMPHDFKCFPDLGRGGQAILRVSFFPKLRQGEGCDVKGVLRYLGCALTVAQQIKDIR